jgi:hypothetical protein
MGPLRSMASVPLSIEEYVPVMSHRSRLRLLVLPALAAAAFGVVACGGEEEPAERAAPPALATPESPETPELRKLDEGAGDAPSTPADAQESVDLLQKNFRDAAATQLKASGLNEEQIDCMLPKLEASVSDAEIEQAMAVGNAEAMLDAAMEAAEDCGAKLG